MAKIDDKASIEKIIETFDDTKKTYDVNCSGMSTMQTTRSSVTGDYNVGAHNVMYLDTWHFENTDENCAHWICGYRKNALDIWQDVSGYTVYLMIKSTTNKNLYAKYGYNAQKHTYYIGETVSEVEKSGNGRDETWSNGQIKESMEVGSWGGLLDAYYKQSNEPYIASSYMCGVSGIKIFDSYDHAKAYIDKGSNKGLISIDNLPPVPETDENDSDGDGGNQDKDIDTATPMNTPSVTPTGVTGASNFYAITSTTAKSFVHYMWYDMLQGDVWESLINSVTHLYANLNSCVLSLRLYPFTLWDKVGNTNKPIILGRFTSEVTALSAENFKPVLNLGSIKISRKYNNFLDYPPYTKGVIYLPYIGFRELDLNVCMNRTITIQYVVDITTGSCDALIFCGGALISSYQGIIGIDIPLNADNGYQWTSNIISGITGAGVSTLSGKGGNVMSATTNSLSSSFSDNVSYNNGSPTPSNGLYYPQYAHVILQRPTYNRPTNYGKRIGYPCEMGFKLGNLSGFTIVDNPTVSFKQQDDVKITHQEIEECYQLLSKGVYL